MNRVRVASLGMMVCTCTWHCIGLQYVLQESLANAKVSARQPCWSKTDFDVKLALEVIYFAIN